MPLDFPPYHQLEEKQLNVLEHPLDQSLFVVGPPGSGKTILAVYRAAMLSDHYSNVILISYNRMLRRLLQLLVNQQNFESSGNIEINTMHSFVWNFYIEKVHMEPPQIVAYQHDWKVMFYHLEQKGISPSSFPMIVDEGQDLPIEFFEFSARFVSNSITVFADVQQAIEDKFSTPAEIKKSAQLNDPIILQLNHRNTPEIIKLAEHFHTGCIPVATAVRQSLGELPELTRSPNLEFTANLIFNWYGSRAGSIGIVVKHNAIGRQIFSILKKRLPRNQIFIYHYPTLEKVFWSSSLTSICIIAL